MMTRTLQYLGMMPGKLRYLEYSDLQFHYVPSQNTEAHVPITHTTRDESYPDHRSANHAGSSRGSSRSYAWNTLYRFNHMVPSEELDFTMSNSDLSTVMRFVL